MMLNHVRKPFEHPKGPTIISPPRTSVDHTTRVDSMNTITTAASIRTEHGLSDPRDTRFATERFSGAPVLEKEEPPIASTGGSFIGSAESSATSKAQTRPSSLSYASISILKSK